MDFLDPRLKAAHTIRLFIGYVLVGVALILATIVLVYAAYGYGINTKTGQIIQNGLLFVDSHPGGAEIFLNGADKRATSAARLTLPAGGYTLSLQKSGYRSWSRHFTLDEHSVARYTYPFLFPDKPQVTQLKAYNSLPQLLTETPDQRWLLVQVPPAGQDNVQFDEYDTGNLTKAPQLLSLPTDLLSGTDKDAARLSVVSWANDNASLLLEHDYTGGSEFIVFNRTHPDSSYNVNKVFKVSPSAVAFRNSKSAQLFIFSATAQTLQVADTSSNTLAAPILRQVLAFKDYNGSNLIYITDKNQPASQAEARLWSNGSTYHLYSFSRGTYLLATAQFQGHPYFVAGSDQSSRLDVFEDPLAQIKNPKFGKAVPLLALNQRAATRLSFSTNARFIEAESGQSLAVYDLEQVQNYHYTVSASLNGPLSWMDGHHLIGVSAGNIYVADYDNTNNQSLVPTALASNSLFSRDFNHLLTVQSTDSGFALVDVDMRAGADLPKSG